MAQQTALGVQSQSQQRKFCQFSVLFRNEKSRHVLLETIWEAPSRLIKFLAEYLFPGLLSLFHDPMQKCHAGIIGCHQVLVHNSSSLINKWQCDRVLAYVASFFFVKGWIARTRTYISTTNTTSEGIDAKCYSQKRLPVGAKHCKTVSTWIRAGFCGISQASALFSRECGFESNWHLDWNWIYHLVDQGGNGKFHSFWRLLHIIAALA